MDTKAFLSRWNLDRVRELGPVVAAAGEKPDPKAMAEVRARLVQRSPYAPPEEETSGSLHHAVRRAWRHFYGSLGLVIYGLIVIAPWLLLLAGVHYGVKRYRRRRARG